MLRITVQRDRNEENVTAAAAAKQCRVWDVIVEIWDYI